MQIGPWAIESLQMRLSHSFGFARLRCVFDVGGTVILENGFLRPERILFNMKLNDNSMLDVVEALRFNKNLIIENFLAPNKLKFPLSRNILEKYFN